MVRDPGSAWRADGAHKAVGNPHTKARLFRPGLGRSGAARSVSGSCQTAAGARGKQFLDAPVGTGSCCGHPRGTERCSCRRGTGEKPGVGWGVLKGTSRNSPQENAAGISAWVLLDAGRALGRQLGSSHPGEQPHVTEGCVPLSPSCLWQPEASHAPGVPGGHCGMLRAALCVIPPGRGRERGLRARVGIHSPFFPCRTPAESSSGSPGSQEPGTSVRRCGSTAMFR